MNYEQALAYIHAVHWQGHKPGLERIRILLDALGARSHAGGRRRLVAVRQLDDGFRVIAFGYFPVLFQKYSRPV